MAANVEREKAFPHRSNIVIDTVAVRKFVALLHAAAAHALEGSRDPGMLQIVRIHPNVGGTMTSRFAIGDVDLMTEDAIAAAKSGFNTYTEGRTVEARTSGRGKAGATRAVFALVDDSDGDKGKAGTLPVEPTWIIESSPGNRHHWFVLDRALTPDNARQIGAAMRRIIGSDSATGKPEQPFRVPGTPNFPDLKKRARGRITSPTRILFDTGPTWTADDLAREFLPAPEKAAGHVPGGRSGTSSNTVENLAAEAGPDRSVQFFRAIRAAIRAGMLPADVEDVFRRYPNGCASKYLQPYDRLAEEIARVWAKVSDKVEQEADTRPVDPTYPDTSVCLDDARAALEVAIREHFAAGAGHRAIQASTGTGKTRETVCAVAAHIRRRRSEGDRSSILYLVPTHRLADEVVARFEQEGITARAFRGRTADDSDMPSTGKKMCLDIEAVDLALRLGLTVSTACCQNKNQVTRVVSTCPLYGSCAYQKQIQDSPAVWVGAHDLLYSAPAGLGQIESVVIDEGFWQSGLKIAKRGVTLDEIGASPDMGGNVFEMMEAADIAAWRSQLVAALRRQKSLGGVERQHLVAEGIDAALCGQANAAEWKLRGRVTFYPGMPKKAREAASVIAQGTGRISKASAAWRAARELLECDDENAVSGLLALIEVNTEDGYGKARAVLTHGRQKVLQRWLDVPMLVLDATLPSLDVLRQFIPDIEVTASIEAKAPYSRVHQVVGAPVSTGKLLKSEAGRNREAVRRAILHRWVQAGRCATLVICRLEMETWLQSAGLSGGIFTAHFGAIAGLDEFKNVGLLIVIGRTLPNVLEVETYAGALTGLEPLRTATPEKGPRWYNRTTLGFRMADGTGYPIQCDRHPDATAEAVRWQICEAGVVQAIGRARAVNRTAADPVQIEIWSDLCLPVTVDEVTAWDDVPTGYKIEMIVDGVVLDSPSDMAVCWPKIWPTEMAARKWRAESTRCLNPIIESLYRDWAPCAFQYQRLGERQKWRQGRFDPRVIPDPRQWLESRLGERAGYELVG
ncbi:DEAD/DEAH box helicase [Lichenifustis flavocetrariae]|uniref:DEAD/DEAH-box helicase domain-containing protein n=1 Tax=Lichenifustis flavocetrariae TaxID=2949735 RepID=A0AA41Z487_9HYPH|nr:DEAD/DEAH box helicase [Lichenifustis flavocetrariae]MCW6512510.1 hypothetical protein [Lichenifustis flavocetrariae]